MNGTVAEGESVYAMVVAVAADPQQRIEYLLAYGDWLREHAAAPGQSSYQSILSDPELAGS